MIRFQPTAALQFYQLVRVGMQFVVAAGLARLLPPAAIAPYESALLYTGILTAAFLSALVDVFLQSPATERRESLSRTILLALGWGLVAGPIGALLLWPEFPDNPTAPLLYGASVFLVPLSFLPEFLLLVRGHTRALVLYGLGNSLLQTASILVPIFLGWGWVAVFGSWAALNVVRTLLALAVGRPSLKRDAFAKLRPHASRLGILLGYAMVGILGDRFDQYLIKSAYPAAVFVLFSYAQKELPLIKVLANAAGKGHLARVSQSIGTPQATLVLAGIRKETRRLIAIAAPTTLGLLLASEWLFGTLYGPEYVQVAVIFNLYLLLAIPRVLLPQVVVLGHRWNQLILRIGTAELLLHMGLSLLLLRPLGLLGIGIAVVVSHLFEKLLLYWACRRAGLLQAEIVPWRTWLLFTLGLLAAYGGWVVWRTPVWP